MKAHIALTVGLASWSGCTSGELAEALGAEMYFVKLDSEPAKVAGLVAELSESVGFRPIHVYDAATEGFSVRLFPEIADEVAALPQVEYVKRDKRERKVPDDDPGEVHEDPAPVLGPDEVPESIERVGGPYARAVDWCHVAVVDTGIDAAHPDLRVVGEFDAVAASGGTPAPGDDPNGHGTHVAGTIGAKGDGQGVVGVAPGVPLHAVRVLDGNGSGYTSDIVAGLEYVLEHPDICVVNMSLGGPAGSGQDPMEGAIQRLEDAGVVVVIAAGNSADDTERYSPAGLDLGVVVSAYDAAGGDNGFAGFSNYGDAVDIAAPGVAILSTWPGGGFAELDGTSMATPAVAGAAAVYKSLKPNARVDVVRGDLVATGEDDYAGQTGGNGKHPEPLLDVGALIDAAGG